MGEPTTVPGGVQATPTNDSPPQVTAATTERLARESPAGTTQLVFFDLDETITRHDTLMPYAWGFMLRYTPWRIPLLLGVLPATLEFALRLARGSSGLADIASVKEAFIRCSMGGSRRATLEKWTAHFVPRLIATGLFADAVNQVAEHRRRGDHLVLMSASTDLYVPVIARELGFNETICTGVRWDGDRLNGSLTTPNRKGAEKARCFTAQVERFPGRTTVAYGNSFTDLPHLRLANRGVLVNGSAKARRAAESFGVVCVDWN